MTIQIGVLTISDTRTDQTDRSGNYIAEQLNVHPFSVIEKIIVKDERPPIVSAFLKLTDQHCDCIITSGGTGIAKRDVTFETLHSMIVQEIPGFGELFRFLSYQDIGSHALASRAFAGFTKENCLLFCLPGSLGACTLAVEKLILPEINHLICERRKDQ